MANEKEFRAGSCEESMRLYSVESHNLASYLVYLVKQQPEKERLKILDLFDQKAAQLTPKSFIYNRRSYSQAGRHRQVRSDPHREGLTCSDSVNKEAYTVRPP